MLKSITQDVVQIIKNDGNIDDYAQNFYTTYSCNISYSDQKLLKNNFLKTNTTRNGGNEEDFNILSNGLFERFAPFLLDVDANLLDKEISLFYNESYFQELPHNAQSALVIQLETLKNSHDNMVDFVIALYKNQENTRVASPGDMMVWRECAAQMTDEQRIELLNMEYLSIATCLSMVNPMLSPVFIAIDYIRGLWSFGNA